MRGISLSHYESRNIKAIRQQYDALIRLKTFGVLFGCGESFDMFLLYLRLLHVKVAETIIHTN